MTRQGCRVHKENEYVIFNVGNIREFCYGTDASAKITWNVNAFDSAAWQRDWVALGVGEKMAEPWSQVLDAYYAADLKDLSRCRAALERARAHLQSILDLEPARNHGKWAGWWNQNVHQCIDWNRDIKCLTDLLKAFN